MAVLDDAQQLATENVVYLTRKLSSVPPAGPGTVEVFRGRLRQASDGEWVFSAYTGQNGFVGLVLGAIDGRWSSGQQVPSGGTVVTVQSLIYNPLVDPANPVFQGEVVETVELSEGMPPVFAE
jgi:hypothetical protein